MDHFNREAEKALSAFDQTHSIKVNYSYELPFGPDKPFLQATACSARSSAAGASPACTPTRRAIR